MTGKQDGANSLDPRQEKSHFSVKCDSIQSYSLDRITGLAWKLWEMQNLRSSASESSF